MSLPPNIAHEKMITLGQLGAPYGVQGWQHVRSYTEPVENILAYKQWYLQQGQRDWQLFEVIQGRKHGKSVVVQLAGLTTPESAALWTLATIAIPRGELPKLEADEFYWTDLEGLAVHNQQDQAIGEVEYLYDNAGQQILVVKIDNKQKQLPFMMNDTITKIDLAARLIKIDWEFI